MTQPLSTEEINYLARKRAGAKMGWYFHAVVYVAVNLYLYSNSVYALGTHHWSLKPLLGWGLGLALHGVSVFVLGKGGGLRERMVQKEREKLLREQGNR